ncbi:hypothetical protein LC612_28250 [Nostoc sp. CHAB 5834]|nr:hypothetical protein [Nostoc sp. CHAB 5834]
MTPESQVTLVKAFCNRLALNPAVNSALVDDWGRYGNFALLIVPAVPNGHFTRKLRRLLTEELARYTSMKGAHIRDIFKPDTRYERDWEGKKRAVGYAQQYWKVDLDFQRYDAASNTFSTS